MYELALCAGIGGISLGLKRAGFRTVCYVERNPYRVAVLKARISDEMLDDAPIWDDVTTFNGKRWRGYVDIVSAGFPCQPFSQGGDMLGEEDERYLWPAIYQVIRDVRPAFIFLENVPGLLKSRNKRPAPISRIFADLAALRYDAEWHSITASAFGYPHERERVFVIAYPCQAGRPCILSGDIRYRVQDSRLPKRSTPKSLGALRDLIPQLEERLGEPAIFGSNDGLSCQLERLEAIGEAVVPDIAEHIGRCIKGAQLMTALGQEASA